MKLWFKHYARLLFVVAVIMLHQIFPNSLMTHYLFIFGMGCVIGQTLHDCRQSYNKAKAEQAELEKAAREYCQWKKENDVIFSYDSGEEQGEEIDPVKIADEFIEIQRGQHYEE